MKRHALPAAILLSAALALTACSAPAAEPSPDSTTTLAKGGSVTIAIPSEPPGTDPIMVRSIAAWNLYYAMYDGLTRIDGAGAVQPGLAESWEASSDLTEWTFSIRDGVTFSNGDAFTAADVVYTYNKILASPTSTNRSAIAMVQSVVENADGDVVFTLANPYSGWEKIVATIGIVPAAVYEAAGDAFANDPVGTGPYIFESATKGVDYVLAKNDDYWGDEPALDSVTFTFVGAEDARVTGVESGTLDVAVVPPNQVPVLQGSDRLSVSTNTGNQVVFLGTNPSAGPLADPDIRRAISMAIDRDAIAERLLGGLAEPTGQIIAPGVTGYVDDFEAPETDVDAATELVESSDYDGEEITLEYAQGGGVAMGSDVAQIIEGYLAEIGLTVRLVGTDQATFSLKLANHEITGLYLNGWAPSSMDGDVVINQLFAGGPEDYSADPEMTALYRKQQAADGAERIAVYSEIAELNSNEAYQIPLYTSTNSYAVNSSVRWIPAVDGIYRVADIALAAE